MLIYIILLAAATLGYLYFLISYTAGWYLTREIRRSETSSGIKVSVIIPARNEEKNIGKILQDLIAQDYPSHLTEVIVVDDNSSDLTASVVKEVSREHQDMPVRLLRVTEEKPDSAYKKKAITYAIGKSSGELIVTTDADCRLGEKWLSAIVALFEAKRPKMIVGPVTFHQESSFFEKMQTLEFLSLIAITAGAIRIGKPIMCNGANLAYEKKAFNESGGFNSDRFSSGDDVFLLLKIRKLFGSKSVMFLKNRDAIVWTEAKKTVSDFKNQRVRWASKNKVYDAKILVVSFTVYMMNLLSLSGLLLGFAGTGFLLAGALAFIVKFFADLPILLGIGRFVRRADIFIYSIPLLIIYPVYIILIGALGILGRYSWKDRKIKN